MNNKGFTMIEILVVVVIVGILTTIALPQYTRSIERSRATEAMAAIKALNDSVYAYAAGRTGATACPTSFKKLAIAFPGTHSSDGSQITSRDFIYTINSATNALIPGTDCPGVTATRKAGRDMDYIIWNPFTVGTAGKGHTLACTSAGDKEASIAVCKSLDIYKGDKPF